MLYAPKVPLLLLFEGRESPHLERVHVNLNVTQPTLQIDM
jgi:hypothetical protein